MAVFLAGLVKLWWITRLLKKQEVLDEEKKARVEEMRRTGLPPKRANDIPFGIRAIQSGVEVPGRIRRTRAKSAVMAACRPRPVLSTATRVSSSR